MESLFEEGGVEGIIYYYMIIVNEMGLDNFFVSYMYNKNNLFNYRCVLLLFSNVKFVSVYFVYLG